MQDLFSISARPGFADKGDILAIAREAACRIALAHPEALKIKLFGSFARGDYGARSDLDLLIVQEHSSRPLHERFTEFQPYVSADPNDMLVLTEAELRSSAA